MRHFADAADPGITTFRSAGQVIRLDNLRKLLHNRQSLIPFVGAGASIQGMPGSQVASWGGLLEHGITTCARVLPDLPHDWVETRNALLRNGDAFTYLAVADEISRRLTTANEWEDWIEAAFNSLHVERLTLQESICKLSHLVVTTNFDTLLEEASPDHPTVTWKEPDKVRKLFQVRSEEKGIIHLHGVASDPSSVILASWQYQMLLDQETVQDIQKAFSTSIQFLFIGTGNGLHDPNIGPLLNYLGDLNRRTKSKDFPHFLLVRGEDLGAALARNKSQLPGILPVAHGAGYQSLESFVRQLADGGNPSASQDPASYGPSVPSTRPTPPGLLDLAGPAEDTLDATLGQAQRCLRTLEQVERRGALPDGLGDWDLMDQLSVQKRTAASIREPSQRLRIEVSRLVESVKTADAPFGPLVKYAGAGKLLPVFVLGEKVSAQCEEVKRRLQAQVDEVAGRCELSHDYRESLGVLLEALDAATNASDDAKGFATLTESMEPGLE